MLLSLLDVSGLIVLQRPWQHLCRLALGLLKTTFSQFLFSSLKLYSGSSVQGVCESLWICFHGTRSRKVTSNTVCTSDDNIKVLSPCFYFWPWDNLSLSLSRGFINNYLIWCYWMLKNVPWMLVAFKTSSRKINILSFISNQTVFLLGKLWNLVQNPWPFLGPSWEVGRDSGPLQHFLRVPRGGPVRSWPDAWCWNLLV